MKIRTVSSALLVLLLAAGVLAHDYWMSPGSFFLQVGGSTPVRLFVGDEFKREEERVLQKDQTSRFELVSPKGSIEDLLPAAQRDQSPIARPRFNIAGNYLLVMERTPQRIELAPDKFTAYLTEEGLNAILDQRQQAGESTRPGRERYSRYLKALFQVGDKYDKTYKRVMGQKLEILPESNPYELKPGQRLKVLVLFDGQPLIGTQVSAYNNADDVVHTEIARTDIEGKVSFVINRTGDWLIRLVYMRRCLNCQDADWESFWGAYSFGVK
jgi:uncharacterized GH25 family protein